MHPRIEVTVDGRPVAGTFYERLVSLSATDKEGVGADTFDATLDDGPPAFLALPAPGAVVEIRLGYLETGMRAVGRYTVDKFTAKCLPYSLQISGKSADLRKGSLKEDKERHWDGKTVQEIVEGIAAENGLAAAVDADIGTFRYAWIAQQDEPDIRFLERLARRHNALFAVKEGRLVLARRGSGLTATGAFAGTVVVTPDLIVQGSCGFEANGRTKYGKVVAYYQDRDRAERVEVEAEGDADGDSVYRLPEPFAGPDEADRAAQAKARQLKRGEGSASVTVVGDTSIAAGAALLFRGVRPGLDDVPYIIDSVTHDYSKSAGFTTKISAKLYDGRSGNGGSEGGEDPASGESGSVAPDSLPGTPPTPPAWKNLRRNGRTDDN